MEDCRKALKEIIVVLKDDLEFAVGMRDSYIKEIANLEDILAGLEALDETLVGKETDEANA